MNKKLTLSLDDDVIKIAKNYAKSNNISLSKLIESYLGALAKTEHPDSSLGGKEDHITPLVKSLSGVISIADDFDAEDAYAQYLMEKYK